MNWPDSHWIWAPDVMQSATDGKYYYLYCQPCRLHLGVSDTPRGPWTNVLGESEAVLVPDRFVHNAITLDGQTFVDDDGSVYMYWGTWGIYPDFGCGAGKAQPRHEVICRDKADTQHRGHGFFRGSVCNQARRHILLHVFVRLMP